MVQMHRDIADVSTTSYGIEAIKMIGSVGLIIL